MSSVEQADAVSRTPEIRALEEIDGRVVRIDRRLARRFEIAAAALGLVVAFVCLSNLLGWVARIEFLKSWWPGHGSMKFNGSLAVLGCSLGAFLLKFRSSRQLWQKVAVLALATVSFTISCATLAEYVLRRPLGIDNLLVRQVAEEADSAYPGRVAPNTAGLVLALSTALALMVLGRRRARKVAQVLSLLSGVLAIFALSGYTYNVRPLYDIVGHNPMSLQGALCLTLVSIALALATPKEGAVAMLASHGIGSLMLRRILPLAVLLPWVIGWIAAYGNRIGLYGGDVDDAILALVLMLLLAAVLYINARFLNRIDAKREMTEDVLRRSSEQWQLTFNCMSEGLSYHDVDYTIVGANNAFRELMPGCAAIDGQKCYSIVHGTCEPSDHCPMRRTLQSGKTEISETYEPRLGKYLRVRTDPVRDKGGKIFRIVHVVEDITDRKKAEENINQLAAIVEQSDDAIFSNDLTGKILSWNKGAERVYGYAEDEALGATLDIFCPSGARNDFHHILDQIAAGKTVKNVEKIRVRKDGSQFWASLTVSPLRDGSGKVIACSAIARDITETKNAEAEIKRRGLEAQQARIELAAVVNSMGEGLYQLDSQGRVLFVNDACEKLLGYSLDEIRGRKMHDLIHGKYPDGTPRPTHDCRLVRVFSDGEQQHEEEDYFQRRDGTFFPVEYTSSPLRTPEGIAGAVLSFRDITERKRAEVERNRLLALERQARRELEAKKTEVEKLNTELEDRVRQRTLELEVANKELEAFSYSVSHDLRAPLRSLDGFSHILLEEYTDKLDEEGQHFLRRLRAASQQMGQLIDALLQLSRMSRTEMTRVPVDLTAIAKNIITDLQKQSPGRQVEIHIDEGLACMGDPRLVHAAIQNLLGNAWKFTGKKDLAKIEFCQSTIDGVPTFFIRDNGAGFDMNYASKLFGAFQRLHSVSEFEGSGIGLATVQRIVRRHGGRVWAEGKLNQGATFYFTLG